VYPERIETASDGRRATFRLRSDLTTASQPVYEMEGSGVQARPSGTVWIRFGEGTDAAARAAEIAAAGYRIERVIGYAPNAALVNASSIADALSHLDALRAIPGVEAVEPQMLMERRPL
jgi:hypothetical protein